MLTIGGRNVGGLLIDDPDLAKVREGAGVDHFVDVHKLIDLHQRGKACQFPTLPLRINVFL